MFILIFLFKDPSTEKMIKLKLGKLEKILQEVDVYKEIKKNGNWILNGPSKGIQTFLIEFANLMKISNLYIADYIFNDNLVFELFQTSFFLDKFKNFLKIRSGLSGVKNVENLIEFNRDAKKISYECSVIENSDIEIEIVEIINEISNCINVEEICISLFDLNILFKNPDLITKLEKEHLTEIVIEKNKMEKYNLFQSKTSDLNFSFKFNYKNIIDIYICEKNIPNNIEVESVLINLDLYGNFLDNFGKSLGEISNTFFLVCKKINQLNESVNNGKKLKHITGIEYFLTQKKGFNIKKVFYSYIKTKEWPNSYKGRCPKFFNNFTFKNNLKEFLLCNKNSERFIIICNHNDNELNNIANELINFALNFNNDKKVEIFIMANNEEQCKKINCLIKESNFFESINNFNNEDFNINNENYLNFEEEKNIIEDSVNYEKNVKINKEISKWLFIDDKSLFKEFDKVQSKFLEDSFIEKKEIVLYARPSQSDIKTIEVKYSHSDKIIYTPDGKKYELKGLKDLIPEVISLVEKENIIQFKFFIEEKKFLSKNSIVILTFFYKIDLKNMEQINIETLKKRKIKREIEIVEKELNNYEIVEDYIGQWQYFYKNKYCNFYHENNEIIENYFKRENKDEKENNLLILSKPEAQITKKSLKISPNEFIEKKFKSKLKNLDIIIDFCNEINSKSFNFYFDSNGEDSTEYFSINLKELTQVNLINNSQNEIRRVLIEKDIYNKYKRKDSFLNKEENNEEIIEENNEENIKKIIFIRGMIKNIDNCYKEMLREFENRKITIDSIKLPNIDNLSLRKELENHLSSIIEGEKNLKAILIKNVIKLEGNINGIQRVKNKLVKFFSRNYKNLYIDFPNDFINKPDEGYSLIGLDKNTSEDYKKISNLFNMTMKDKFNIKSIEKIYNKKLFKLYSINEKLLNEKLENKINKTFLFHGTSETDPKVIYGGNDESFDMRLSNEGMWGKGIYFAENASYSNDYRSKNKNYYQMIVAEVILGDYIELISDSKIKRPPPKYKDKGIKYDSIKGFTNGSNIFIIYENNRAYPFYLISYT